MCVVSMVSDHYMGQYPEPLRFPPNLYPDFAELIRKARLYDEMTGQRDCPDPNKVAWQKAVEELMREKYGLTPKTE